MNPCPCGWLNDPQKASGCATAVVTKYQKRISGPILDRKDIHIEVPRVDYEKLSNDRLGESSESIRARVQAVRDIQTNWFASYTSDIVCNADMRVGEIKQFCKLKEEGQRLIRAAMSQLHLSTRAYHRFFGCRAARGMYSEASLDWSKVWFIPFLYSTKTELSPKRKAGNFQDNCI